MSTIKKRIECIVRGRVQLVMFRDFTKRKAEEFGIVGTVRNEKDGTVRVIAEGDETHLVLFLKQLEKGPFLSRVDSIETNLKDPTNEFSDFQILYV
ncbi:MAG: acylphosphatase [Patescibacteria group bacterium]